VGPGFDTFPAAKRKNLPGTKALLFEEIKNDLNEYRKHDEACFAGRNTDQSICQRARQNFARQEPLTKIKDNELKRNHNGFSHQRELFQKRC
jgi:hypothetical protein